MSVVNSIWLVTQSTVPSEKIINLLIELNSYHSCQLLYRIVNSLSVVVREVNYMSVVHIPRSSVQVSTQSHLKVIPNTMATSFNPFTQNFYQFQYSAIFRKNAFRKKNWSESNWTVKGSMVAFGVCCTELHSFPFGVSNRRSGRWWCVWCMRSLLPSNSRWGNRSRRRRSVLGQMGKNLDKTDLARSRRR